MYKRIIIVLIIIVSGAYSAFAQSKGGKNKTPASKSTNTDVKTMPYVKKKGNCASFGMSEAARSPLLKLNLNDTSTIPDDFPPPPAGSQPCGCIKYLNTAYYTSPLTEIEIFNYYQKVLVENGYFWDTPKAGGAPNQYMMTFYKKDMDGHVYVHGDKGGFAVMYKPKKPCSCEKNKKKKEGEGDENPKVVN